MNVKLTILILLVTVLTAAHCIFGFFVIKEETTKDLITLCQYIWIYNLVGAIGSALQTIGNIIIIVFAILVSDTKRSRCLISYMIKLALLVIFGIIILTTIHSDCRNTYETSYPKTWLYFTITVWYSVAVWGIFATITVLYYLYSFCCKCFCKSDN